MIALQDHGVILLRIGERRGLAVGSNKDEENHEKRRVLDWDGTILSEAFILPQRKASTETA